MALQERYRSWLKSSLKSIGKLVMLSAVVFLLKMGFKRLQHVLSVLTVLYGQYVKYYKRLDGWWMANHKAKLSLD